MQNTECILKRDDGKYFMFSLAEGSEYEVGSSTDEIYLARRCADEAGANKLLNMLPDKQRWNVIRVRVVVEEVK